MAVQVSAPASVLFCSTCTCILFCSDVVISSPRVLDRLSGVGANSELEAEVVGSCRLFAPVSLKSHIINHPEHEGLTRTQDVRTKRGTDCVADCCADCQTPQSTHIMAARAKSAKGSRGHESSRTTYTPIKPTACGIITRKFDDAKYSFHRHQVRVVLCAGATPYHAAKAPHLLFANTSWKELSISFFSVASSY